MLAIINNVLNLPLLVAGTALVSVPIIIHLLNRRKFKVVDWAAMDFLMEADRLNRRRVRIEDLILLLLRCLVIFLIGLTLARPFLSRAGGFLFGGTRYDRLVLFDDSISMGARSGGSTPLEKGKKQLTQMVSELASSQSNDTLTLLLLSKPEKPLFVMQSMRGAAASEVFDRIKNLQLVDRAGDLNSALMEIQKAVKDERSGMSRMVYLMTDQRAKDWSVGEGESPVVKVLKEISDRAAGVFIVDLASEETANVSVASITPQDKTLIAGVPTRFDVAVRNHGDLPVKQVKIRFSVADALALEETIDVIKPHATKTVAFSYLFEAGNVEDEDRLRAVPIKVELAGGGATDLLEKDNQRVFPGRITPGIRTLIVDGDPSSEYGKSETFFLRKALAPRGPVKSGVSLEVVDDTGFESLDLADFQIIFICNLYRMSEEKRIALEAWVRQGGGLVFILGDQVDEQFYNEKLHAGGDGLLPVRLEGVQGEASGESWVHFNLKTPDHSALAIFAGENNNLLEDIKVFRWWQTTLPAETSARLLAGLTAPESVPGMVEGHFGKGRTFVLTTPLDLEWNNWPQNRAAYLIFNHELLRHLARDESGAGLIQVGEAIHVPVNLSAYKVDAKILPVEGEPVAVQAKPQGPENDQTWVIDFEETYSRGVYVLELTPTDREGVDRIPFAANLGQTESDLRKQPNPVLAQALGESPVQFVKDRLLVNLESAHDRNELWKTALILLAIALCGEQCFAWWLGRKRAV
ncbi:MAG: BatA domain-containing protein [Verrucomicrobiota bacterium]